MTVVRSLSARFPFGFLLTFGTFFQLYGYDRGLLECNDLYCHFRAPKKILDEMDMANTNIYANLIYISVVCVVMHFLTFIVLYVKLNNR